MPQSPWASSEVQPAHSTRCPLRALVAAHAGPDSWSQHMQSIWHCPMLLDTATARIVAARASPDPSICSCTAGTKQASIPGWIHFASALCWLGWPGLSSPGHECWPEDAQKERADTTCHRNTRNGRVGGEDHQHDRDGQGQGLPACPISRQSAKGHTGLGLAGGASCPTPGLQDG